MNTKTRGKTVKRCTTKTVVSPVKTTTRASARLSRNGRVRALGHVSRGRLVLRASRPLRPGRYTLTLAVGRRVTRQTVTLR